jgi:hypothetical protein
VCTTSTKDIQSNKEAENTTEEVEKYFLGFLAFIDCTEQQIPRPKDKNRRKIFYSDNKKRMPSRIRLWLIIMIVLFIKWSIKMEGGVTLIFNIPEEPSCHS